MLPEMYSSSATDATVPPSTMSRIDVPLALAQHVGRGDRGRAADHQPEQLEHLGGLRPTGGPRGEFAHDRARDEPERDAHPVARREQEAAIGGEVGRARASSTRLAAARSR